MLAEPLGGEARPGLETTSNLTNVAQQVGGSPGLALLVTVFGTASRNATEQASAAATVAVVALVLRRTRAAT